MKKIGAFIIVFITIVGIRGYLKAPVRNSNEIKTEVSIDEEENKEEEEKVIDWELTLVNYENELSSDFKIQLSNIDKIRQFDSRGIDYLNEMLLAMKNQGISNIWVQSSYRSIEQQQEVFDKQVKEYIKKRKNKSRSRRINFKNNK